MTIEEFNKTKWTGGMVARYRGFTYRVASVDFGEQLVGLFLNISGSDETEVSWVRCENCELLNK